MISDILIMTYYQYPQDVPEEELVRRLREIRDAELKATDFWGLSDRTMTDAQKKYRQELRDCIATIKPKIDKDGHLVMTDFPTYTE
jgi:hypothetical protein|tara:strand:- start:48 stop:305 length:258 start_codon:yes stop_codon:yes gene_type:complete